MPRAEIDKSSGAFLLIERIAKVRNWSGSTRQVFAEMIGVSASYYSQVEKGNNKPNVDMVLGIADKFPEIRLDWLLRGEGDMTGVEISAIDSSLAAKIGKQLEGFWASKEKETIGTYELFRDCTDAQQKICEDLLPKVLRFRMHHAAAFSSVLAAIYEKVAGIKDPDEQFQKFNRYAVITFGCL